MSAQLPSKARDSFNAVTPSPEKAAQGPSATRPADLDKAVDDLIAYLAEEAHISPAEAFSAVAQGHVVEVPGRSDQRRPRLTAGLSALFRHLVRKS
jgi:hypothetical protein